MTARDRRTMAVGSVAAVALLAFWLALGPDSRASGGGADRAALLAEYRALAADSADVEQAWQRGNVAHAAMKRQLLPETNPTLAGAGLSRIVNAMAQQSDVRLDRTALGTPRPVDDVLIEVSLSVDLSGDIHGLHEFLSRVERAPQALTLGNLRISALDGPAGRGRPRGDPPLRAQLSIIGYALAQPVAEEGP